MCSNLSYSITELVQLRLQKKKAKINLVPQLSLWAKPGPHPVQVRIYGCLNRGPMNAAMNRTNGFLYISLPRTSQVVTLNEGLIQPLPQTRADDGDPNHLLVKTRMYSSAKPLILIPVYDIPTNAPEIIDRWVEWDRLMHTSIPDTRIHRRK